MTKRKNNSDLSPGEAVRTELALNAEEWYVGIGYSKGFLSGSRGVQVTVTNLKSGKTKSQFVPASGKAAARRDAITIVRKLVQELR
jgi:hypothetical protein